MAEVEPLKDNPVERIKAMVKNLFLTPGPSGGQLYSMNQIISQVNKKEKAFGRIVTADVIYGWSFERNQNTPDRATWSELLALSAAMGLTTKDRLEDRTWEETIYQRIYEMQALHANQALAIRGVAIEQLNNHIQLQKVAGIPPFRDIQEALLALNVANGALMSSFNPMSMRQSSGTTTRRRK